MSRRRKKKEKKTTKPVKPKQALSSQQQFRLQKAAQAQVAGHLPFAEAEYRQLIGEKAKAPQLFRNLALICDQTARFEEARMLWRKALAFEPGNPDIVLALADSYQRSGKVERAVTCYRKVLAGHPNSVVARYLLANLLKAQGKLDEAADCYRQIMARQPDYTQAHFTYSGIHKYRDRDDPHLTQMLELYEKGNLQAENRIHLAFALAKAFEDIGDYPRAFGYMETGNELRRAEFHYDVGSDAELFENIIQTFSREAISKLQVNAQTSDRPIFIVGMPRSGTSLVEQILSAHTEVFAAGELDYMFSMARELFMDEAIHYHFRALETYPVERFETIGRAYLDRIGRLQGQARYITDKMPFNMMMLGLIRIALPHAKIIHCVRDAKDTCLSIYKQNFTTQNYRFAYDLRTIGQFYKQYQKLMEHWQRVLPDMIYDISYEALTQDPEREIRKLLSACGLEFQSACLNFEKSDNVVKTASFYQVRQPMYTSSVRLWEKYRDYLQPLIAELDAD